MSPAETVTAVKRRLAAELEEDAAAIERLAEGVSRLSSAPGDEWMRALALAFEMDRYYSAVEATLVRIVRTLDGDLPSGSGWHNELLRAASVAVEGLRPAIVSRSLAGELRELLRFRHAARHAYEHEPDMARMTEHVLRIARTHRELLAAIDALRGWLRA